MSILPVFYETRRVGAIQDHDDGASFVLMPACVEAIKARARAIISGLSEDEPKSTASKSQTREPSAKKPRKKKAKAATP